MQQPVFRVGEWLVTPANNQISRDGRQKTLEPRLIDMLFYFAQHPDVVLSRDELIDNVWKRNIVTNHVVTQSISELRKYLKDGDGNGREYIVTVPKRGYKLAAPVMWCEEGELLPPAAPQVAVITHEPEDGGEDDAQDYIPPRPAAKPAEPARNGRRFYQRSPFWVWLSFLAALSACVAFVGIATLSQRVPVATMPMLLNPRDIDIRIQGGNSCSNWMPQLSYVVGLSELIADSLNTYSTFLVHDQTNYNYGGPSSSGKSLTIEFVNQRHYRAQQCFLSVKLVDNADSAIMLDKRYFITTDNQLKIQADLLNSMSVALKQPWPPQLLKRLNDVLPQQGPALQQFYQAHQLLIQGDVESLTRASELLSALMKSAPDFIYSGAEKALVDVLRNSYQPFDSQQSQQLRDEISRLEKLPQLQDSPILQQIYTVEALGQGRIDDAYRAINKAIDMQMSWINYVLLGKVYEMQGRNHLAADSYITAFNLRPGENTLHWIRNGVFQTSISAVVPYLSHYDADK
ncbi:lysine decarboxylation/transport transcriptional activator CadC [Serratia odorifera]|uniref:Transcriptional regulatory protein, C-terminal domain protein n=1 Tax=Serratia odorifera DSM 4582 TaxID=667129 RepID=D4E2F2_SEROD|nr:lysine decarboxylation/transport transcriptional activator CadC [Serratia odorifera]EFE96087.1 transcriptional regulatory protein, C-terminal domain protein [Serratia odorifera DSM 4582]MBJ2067303.1 lysine decarboxylation/transport transcriptional activator CadC [Serratia odorifera]PNK90635.1 transcriptional regulator CadC [Serratia odorifera]RII71769.1 transcriptional regulator CadC [Serratia odorifera]HEJ9097593.1 lysine decarboxylation/transport transcriptional activator CadC [Serratia o